MFKLVQLWFYDCLDADLPHFFKKVSLKILMMQTEFYSQDIFVLDEAACDIKFKRMESQLNFTELSA